MANEKKTAATSDYMGVQEEQDVQEKQSVQGELAADCCGKDSPSCCGQHKHTPRSEELVRDIDRRINRAIGQLNGVKAMLDDNRYCGDTWRPAWWSGCKQGIPRLSTRSWTCSRNSAHSRA